MSSSPPSRRARQREAKSLDLTQRVILSVIVAVVFGSFSAVLAAYLAVRGDRDLPHFSVVGLWIMTGVMGVSLMPVSNPRPSRPDLKNRVLVHSRSMRSGSFSSTSMAARHAAATAGGWDVENRNGRERWTR